MKIRLNQAGDTLVEVMLAAAILSLVLAGAFTISNRATRINQGANERTQVSNLVQAEAEAIRSIHTTNPDNLWDTFSSTDPSTPSYVSPNTNYCDLVSGTGFQGGAAFFVESDLSLALVSKDASNAVIDSNENDFFDVWVEADESAAYVDFYIYACWDGIGGEGMQNTGAVLRLAK